MLKQILVFHFISGLWQACAVNTITFSTQTQVKLLFPHPWTGNPIKPREMKSSSLRNMFTSDLWESFHRVPRSTNNKILPVTAFISWGELGGKRFSCAVEVHFHALEKKLCVCKRMKCKPDSLCSVSAKGTWGDELPPPQSKQPCRPHPWHRRWAQGSDPDLQMAPLSTLTSGARISQDLPFATCPTPSYTLCLCSTLHAELPDLLLGTLTRSVFTGNFTLDKASLLKKQQKSSAT